MIDESKILRIIDARKKEIEDKFIFELKDEQIEMKDKNIEMLKEQIDEQDKIIKEYQKMTDLMTAKGSNDGAK